MENFHNQYEVVSACKLESDVLDDYACKGDILYEIDKNSGEEHRLVRSSWNYDKFTVDKVRFLGFAVDSVKLPYKYCSVLLSGIIPVTNYSNYDVSMYSPLYFAIPKKSEKQYIATPKHILKPFEVRNRTLCYVLNYDVYAFKDLSKWSFKSDDPKFLAEEFWWRYAVALVIIKNRADFTGDLLVKINEAIILMNTELNIYVTKYHCLQFKYLNNDILTDLEKALVAYFTFRPVYETCIDFPESIYTEAQQYKALFQILKSDVKFLWNHHEDGLIPYHVLLGSSLGRFGLEVLSSRIAGSSTINGEGGDNVHIIRSSHFKQLFRY